MRIVLPFEVDEEGDAGLDQTTQLDLAAQQALDQAKHARQEAHKVLLAAQGTSAKRRKLLGERGKLDLAKAAAAQAGQLPPHDG